MKNDVKIVEEDDMKTLRKIVMRVYIEYQDIFVTAFHLKSKLSSHLINDIIMTGRKCTRKSKD